MANATWTILSWSDDEAITSAKLNSMVSNTEYVRQQMPTANYRGFGTNKKDGVRFLCGVTTIPKSNDVSKSKDVDFNSFLNEACKPIVTTSIVSPKQTKVFLVISGKGKPFPDASGFTATVTVADGKDGKIIREIYVPWIAMGW